MPIRTTHNRALRWYTKPDYRYHHHQHHTLCDAHSKRAPILSLINGLVIRLINKTSEHNLIIGAPRRVLLRVRHRASQTHIRAHTPGSACARWLRARDASANAPLQPSGDASSDPILSAHAAGAAWPSGHNLQCTLERHFIQLSETHALPPPCSREYIIIRLPAHHHILMVNSIKG